MRIRFTDSSQILPCTKNFINVENLVVDGVPMAEHDRQIKMTALGALGTKINTDEVKKAIDDFLAIDRDDDRYEDTISFIAENASNEAYENSKGLRSVLAQYKDNEAVLRIIDETLIAICGWGITTCLKSGTNNQ